MLGGCRFVRMQRPGRTTSRRAVPRSESLDELQGEAFIDTPSLVTFERARPVYAGMYNPYNVPIVDDYIEVIDGLLEGFSPVASGRLRFAAPIDPASMLQTKSLIEPDASVQLINVDPD